MTTCVHHCHGNNAGTEITSQTLGLLLLQGMIHTVSIKFKVIESQRTNLGQDIWCSVRNLLHLLLLE